MHSLILSLTYSLLFFSLGAQALDNDTKETTFSLKQEHCQFAGTFKQVKQLEGIDLGIVSNGVFFHHCNKGVIWSTTEPLLETLVMRRDGKGFVVSNNEQNQLESRQGKFLSSLLNSLMSGDQNAIEKQFKLSTSETGVITLTPKKRSLKRAIKSINVERSLDAKSVNIIIIDRHLQKTAINSTQTEMYSNDSVLKNCKLSITTHTNSPSSPLKNITSSNVDSCNLLLHPINKNSADNH